MNDRARQAMEKLQARIEKAQEQLRAAGITPIEIEQAEPTYQCEVCQDLGVVRQEDAAPGHPNFGRLLPCPGKHCQRAKENRDRLFGQRMALGLAHYSRYTFETWRVNISEKDMPGKYAAFFGALMWAESGADYVSSWDILERAGALEATQGDRRNNWLVLFGPVGRGKTGLAAAAVNCLSQMGIYAVFLRTRELIETVQEQYSPEAKSTPAEIKRQYINAPVLVLDEMTIENPTPDRLEIVEEIIRARYASGLPMLITTNLDQTAFANFWGQRTADVLFERAHWLHVGGVALRQRNNPLSI